MQLNTWHSCTDTAVRLAALLGVQDLGRVPSPFIAAALLPALVITLLFFFDHSISSQMAQQPEFSLEKPSAYHYDFLLLGIMTLACGLIGVPPVNGVLPQVRQPQVLQQTHVL